MFIFRIYESNTILLGKKDGLEKDSPGGLSDVATIQYKGNRNTQVTSMLRLSALPSSGLPYVFYPS